MAMTWSVSDSRPDWNLQIQPVRRIVECQCLRRPANVHPIASAHPYRQTGPVTVFFDEGDDSMDMRVELDRRQAGFGGIRPCSTR
jgi:hypothetical protein